MLPLTALHAADPVWSSPKGPSHSNSDPPLWELMGSSTFSLLVFVSNLGYPGRQGAISLITFPPWLGHVFRIVQSWCWKDLAMIRSSLWHGLSH